MKAKLLTSSKKEPDIRILTKTIETPIGPLELYEKDLRLVGVQFKRSKLETSSEHA